MLGNRLKSLRKDKKLRQEDIAEKLGIARTTYAMYEQGKREPDNNTLQKLADFFNVQIDYLLGRSSTKVATSGRVHEEKYDYRDDPRVQGELKEMLDLIVRLPEEQQKRIIEQTLVFAAGLQAKNRSSEKE